jgi:hypothetical protein
VRRQSFKMSDSSSLASEASKSAIGGSQDDLDGGSGDSSGSEQVSQDSDGPSLSPIASSSSSSSSFSSSSSCSPRDSGGESGDESRDKRAVASRDSVNIEAPKSSLSSSNDDSGDDDNDDTGDGDRETKDRAIAARIVASTGVCVFPFSERRVFVEISLTFFSFFFLSFFGS